MKKENINEEWSKHLAEVLKAEIRKRKEQDKNYKQETFAEGLNMSPSTLTLLLKEERNPSLDTLFDIAKALNCSIDYLVGLSSVKEREWNDIDKSSVLIQKETGLSKRSINKLLNLKKASSTEFVDTINELICSNTLIIEKIRDYLLYQPDDENTKYKYDGGKRIEKENDVPELLKLGLKGSITTIQYEYLDVEDIDNAKIEKIKTVLPFFKETSYRSYLKNKERLDNNRYYLEDLESRFNHDEISEDEYLQLQDEYSRNIEKYSDRIERYERNHGGLNNGKE